MSTQPYWITDQLAIVPRPTGGDLLDDEMVALREAGIDVVVSMLEADEAQKAWLGEEARSAECACLVFINFPIRDGNVPSDKPKFLEFIAGLEDHISSGRRVGIHCRGCIGRASVTSASLLIRSGVSPENAWAKISESRGCDVPDTAEQREWVERNIESNT